jgi:hypothetical protein
MSQFKLLKPGLLNKLLQRLHFQKRGKGNSLHHRVWHLLPAMAAKPNRLTMAKVLNHGTIAARTICHNILTSVAFLIKCRADEMNNTLLPSRFKP